MSVPKTIYLQLGEDVKPREVTDWDTGDVTWCRDKINDNDIEYTLSKELKRLRKIEAAAKVVIAYSGGCDDELLYDALPYLAEALEEGETE